MTESTGDHRHPPILASPGRQIFHMLIAAAGWVLFVWWWWLVLRSVSLQAVRFTAIFVVVTAAVVVLVTVVWAVHNALIFKRRGPRTQLREVAEDYSRDRLGRHVVFAESRDVVQNRPIVQIRLEHQGKVYRTTARPQARSMSSSLPIGSESFERQRVS